MSKENTSVPFAGNEQYRANYIRKQAGDTLKETKAQDKSLNNKEEQAANISASNAQQKAIQEAYDAGQKSAISNVYGKNLRDNPLGNLNDMSAADTLALSRQADAYNNRVRYQGGDIGARTFSMGSSGITTPTLQKVSPIETQEMRQMRANEDVDKYARQEQARLAADIERHGLNLQEQRDQNIMQIAQQYGLTDPAILQQLRSLALDINYGNPMRKAQDLISTDLLNKIKARFGGQLANYYLKLYRSYPNLAATMANYAGMQLPTWAAAQLDSAAAEIVSDIKDPMERIAAQKQLQAIAQTASAQIDIDTMRSTMSLNSYSYGNVIKNLKKRLQKEGKTSISISKLKDLFGGANVTD